MVLFKSPHPDIQIPTNVTTYQWLFESLSASPLHQPNRAKPLAGFIDAFTHERLDWAQVKQKAEQLSTVLVRQYGLCPGDTVSLFSTNTIWYPVAMFAVSRVGGCVNGASPAYTADEMAYAMKIAHTKILITLPSSLSTAVTAAEKAGVSPNRILLLEDTTNKTEQGFLSIQQLMADVGERIARKEESLVPTWSLPEGISNANVCGFLNFSSGTTGLPKAVMLSHHNLIAQSLQLKQLQADSDEYKILAVMPLFHITGLVRFCHYPILMNGDSIMLPKYSLESMCQAIQDFQISELILVPPILLRLARDPAVNRYNLRHVKRWSSGSAPISAEVIRSLQERFPWTGFRQGYGATESTACVSCHPPTHYDYQYASTGGMLVANTVAKIVDIVTGDELGPNQTGEILAKGPQIAMGYLGNEAASRETFDPDGFLHLGDVGRIDSHGLIHIEDRIKEMIKVKGLQVPPAELEDLLLGHAAVDDCAVVGIPDEYAGERPKAFVVLKKDQGGMPTQPNETTGRMLLDYVKSKTVRYKWLVEVEFVDAVPKSPTGKLLRRVLKARERDTRDDERGFTVRDVRERAKL